MRSFRLWTIFYVFALSAAAMATFGPWGGIFAALWVLMFWGWMLYRQKTRPTALAILSGAFLVLLLIGLLLPAVSSARAAAQRNLCMSHLKVIAVGLHNYHDTRGTFPPAYIADASGKPMHSWRVLILPYLDEPWLFQKYNMNEPWDGPNNSKLAAQVPAVYRCPQNVETAGNMETNYFAVLAPETAWGKSMGQLTDGSSKTIMVIEAAGLGIDWMEPRDVTLDEAIELLTTNKDSGHKLVDDGFLTTTYYATPYRNVVYCDGHVEWMGQLKDPAIAKALFTIAGGERMNFDDGQSRLDLAEPKTTTIVKWGKVWGLSIFVLLALLPVASVKRKPMPAESEKTKKRVGDV